MIAQSDAMRGVEREDLFKSARFGRWTSLPDLLSQVVTASGLQHSDISTKTRLPAEAGTAKAGGLICHSFG